jgi:uncharacterized protein
MSLRIDEPEVAGWLHEADGPLGIVLAHGAGSNCESKLMVAVAGSFAAAGVRALRIDLPFRRARPSGPPHPSAAGRDRDGIRAAARWLGGRVLLGGHSYSGRMASVLAAEDPSVAEALLLLSYPLHPPRRPEQSRAAHFAALRVPTLFVHGTRDAFATPEQLRSVLPPCAELMLLERSGHELKGAINDPGSIVTRFLALLRAQ